MDKLSLDVGACDSPRSSCKALVVAEYGPESFYSRSTSPLSVVSLVDWRPSKVASYNARRCERFGYVFSPLISRSDWIDDMHALKSSAEERQGRRMPDHYFERQEYGRDSAPECPRHGYRVHGVVADDGRLVAYAQIYQCGDVARVNSLLAHAENLVDGCMWLCLFRAMEWHRDELGATAAVYYTHDSGTAGLRYFKERLGFRPARVTWKT